MGAVLMSSSYPLNGEVVCTERVARWRPLVNWVLVIPLYLWVVVLGYGAAVVSLAGWFAILFTGRLPERMGDYLVAVLRYQWRVMAFLFGLTTSYPGFPVVAGYVDPGSYPAVLYSARPTARRRRLWWQILARHESPPTPGNRTAGTHRLSRTSSH